MFEKEANIKTELQAKLDDVTAKYQKAITQVGEAEQYKVQASSNDAIVQEKSRIQSALNDEMKKTTSLKNDLQKVINEKEVLNKELNNLKLYLEKVKELVPISKLKKIELEEKPEIVLEKKDDTPKIKNNLQKILDGSTF